MKLKKSMKVSAIITAIILGAGAVVGSGSLDNVFGDPNFSCTSDAVTSKVTSMNRAYIEQRTFTAMLTQPKIAVDVGPTAIYFTMVSNESQFNALYNRVIQKDNPTAGAYEKVMAAAKKITTMVTFAGWGEVKNVPHNENVLQCSAGAQFQNTNTPFRYQVMRNKDDIQVVVNPARDLAALF